LAKRVDKRKYKDRREYFIKAVYARRKKIRQMSVEYKGGKCEICGYSRCIDALEFHHRDSSKKDFGVSSKGYTRSWKRVAEELDKCSMLCANCHRELHAQVSSACRKLQDEKRVNSGKPHEGNPEPSPNASLGKVQRLDTRCLKSEMTMAKV